VFYFDCYFKVVLRFQLLSICFLIKKEKKKNLHRLVILLLDYNGEIWLVCRMW